MESKFDRASKALAKGVSRRDAMRWVGGGLVGLLGAFGLGEAQAQRELEDCRSSCQRIAQYYGYDYNDCRKACERCFKQRGSFCANRGGVTCCPSATSCCGSYDGTRLTCCSNFDQVCCNSYYNRSVAQCCAAGPGADPSAYCDYYTGTCVPPV